MFLMSETEFNRLPAGNKLHDDAGRRALILKGDVYIEGMDFMIAKSEPVKICRCQDCRDLSFIGVSGLCIECAERLGIPFYDDANAENMVSRTKRGKNNYKRMTNQKVSPFPYNLVCDIFGEEITPEMFTMEKDQLKGLYTAMEQNLSKRDMDIVLMRYRDKMSYDAIGEKYILSKQRIGQIIDKALVDVAKNHGLDHIMLSQSNPAVEICQLTDADIMAMPLEFCCMTEWVRNRLHNSEIYTVGELCEAMASGKLLEIKHFGATCIQECMTLVINALTQQIYSAENSAETARPQPHLVGHALNTIGRRKKSAQATSVGS